MVVCRLCSQEFPTNWKLNIHLKSSKHQRQTVICPWCPVERTYTRTVDLRNHCEKSHAVETKRLGNSFFSSGNCFYFAIYPEDYAVICNVEEWGSQNAMEARRLIEKWVEWQPGSSVKKEVWRKGWKTGLRLAAEHRGRVQSDRGLEGDENGEEMEKMVETESGAVGGGDEHDVGSGIKSENRVVIKQNAETVKIREEDAKKKNVGGDVSVKVVKIVDVVDKSEKESNVSLNVLQDEKAKHGNEEKEKIVKINVIKSKACGDSSEKVVNVVKVTDKRLESSEKSAQEMKCKVIESERVLKENVEKERFTGSTNKNVANLGEGNNKRESVKEHVNRKVDFKVLKSNENVLNDKVDITKVSDKSIGDMVNTYDVIQGNKVESSKVVAEKENVDRLIHFRRVEADRELERAVQSIMPETNEETPKSEIEKDHSVKTSKREKEREHRHKKDKKKKRVKKSKEDITEKRANGQTWSANGVEKDTLPSISVKEMDEYIADLKSGLDIVNSGVQTPLIDEEPRETDIEGELSVVSELLSLDKEKKGLKRSVGQENRQEKKVKITTNEYRARKPDVFKSKPKADGEVGIVNNKGDNVVLKQGEDMIWYKSKGQSKVPPESRTNISKGDEKRDITNGNGSVDLDEVEEVNHGTGNDKEIVNSGDLEVDIECIGSNSVENHERADLVEDREVSDVREPDRDNMAYKANVVGNTISTDTSSYVERARYVLSRGVMPLCPPAPRQWSTDLNWQVSIPIGGSRALIWPPTAWETMTPDRKLLSAESAAMTLESCLYSHIDPKMSRAYLMDKYRYLILPGSAKIYKEVAEEASNKTRCYLYHAIREIATGKQPSVAEREQLAMLETISGSQMLAIDPSTMNIPLRLTKDDN